MIPVSERSTAQQVSKLPFKIFTFSLVVHIICFIGCLYQIVSICELYYHYHTNVLVKFQQLDYFETPVISLCARRERMVDSRKFVNKVPNLQKEIDRRYANSNYTLSKTHTS